MPNITSTSHHIGNVVVFYADTSNTGNLNDDVDGNIDSNINEVLHVDPSGVANSLDLDYSISTTTSIPEVDIVATVGFYALKLVDSNVNLLIYQ